MEKGPGTGGRGPVIEEDTVCLGFIQLRLYESGVWRVECGVASSCLSLFGTTSGTTSVFSYICYIYLYIL